MILDEDSDYPKRQIDAEGVVPLLCPTHRYLTFYVPPRKFRDDAEYCDHFSKDRLDVVVLGLRTVSCLLLVCADSQTLPHCTDHDPDQGRSDDRAHKQRPPGMGTSTTLRESMPELFPGGTCQHRHLFGCPECDLLMQVSIISGYLTDR